MTDPILDALDPDQRQVATTLEQPVVVLAAAGSGKTRAITHRVAYAVREGVYQPAATLAVTFTTRAAGEMRSRLAQLGVRQAAARTIHAAALRQCQYFWPKAYGSAFPAVAENTFGIIARAANAVVGNAEVSLVRDLEQEIAWAKSTNVPAARYPELAGSRTVSGVTPTQVAAIFSHYEKAKLTGGVVDFHDILLCTVNLLAEHEAIAKQIRETYRHFVVDEYQDISGLQHRLIELWAAGRKDICVVGDPNQAIHGFAGADPAHLLSLAESPRTQIVRLNRNYRSTPEICGVGNTVLRQRQALRPVRGNGQPVSFESSVSEETEAEDVVQWLKTQRDAGLGWHQMAVLYRINAQSPSLEGALSAAGIPYSVRGAERFYDRPEVSQALQALTRIAEEVQTKPDLVRIWAESVGFSDQAPTSMGRQRERWESLNALRQSILDTPGTPSQIVATLTQKASMQSVPVAHAVTLSTMHAAKGLEWEAVAVIGVREGLMPFSLSTEEPALSEERRLLHVAVTRAKDQLRVSWTTGGRTHGSPSRFLGALVPRQTAAAVAKQPGSKKLAVCRVCGKPLDSAAERKLRRHEDCESEVDEELFEALRSWRKAVADEASMPAFVIFTDATLLALAEAKPSTEKELLAVPGIGAVKVERYGAQCLAVIAEHR